MKKYLLICLLIFGIVACGNKNESSQSEKPTVKIGVIDALSGKYAENGQNVRQAIEFAKQDIKSDIDFEFIFEDYGFEAMRAATAANKLINADKVDALISWSSLAGNVTAPLAERNKIVHFSICNDAQAAQGKYNFTHFTPSEQLAEKLVEQIEQKNAKKVALFAVYQPALQKHTDAVENLLKAKGIAFERFNFTMDNLDFSLMLEKAKLENFDVWYLCALPPSLDVFLKNYFQKQINVPLVAIDSLLFAQDKQMVDGMTFVTTPEGNGQLLQRLTKANGSTNYFSVGYAYDVAALLIKAYSELYDKNGKLPSSDEVADYLLNLHGYKGAVGAITMGKDGIVLSDAVIKQMKDGKPVTIE